MNETAIVPAAANNGTMPQRVTAMVVPGGSACPKLSEALAAARDRCKAASKDGNNQFHKYRYATADEVIATACDALTGSGLAIIPVSEELTVAGSGARTFYALNRTLILSHASGEFTPLEVRGWPVIEDKGRPLDKAYAVALTTSLAYKLRDLLQMPRGEQFGDMDQRDDREHVPPPSPQPQRPNPAVQQAAAKLDATPTDRQPPVQFTISKEQADNLRALVDGKFLAPEDFGTVYGFHRAADVPADSYEEVYARAKLVDAIRKSAGELGIEPGGILAGLDVQCLLELDPRKLADVSLDLLKRKQAAAKAAGKGAAK